MKTINDQILTMKQVGLLSILSIFGKQKPDFPKFPKEIAGFSFDRQILRRPDRPLSFAIYRNDKGKKAVAKMWSGIKKDFSSQSLENERLILAKINALDRNNYQNISVPKILGFVKNKKQIILLSEKVEGITIDQIPLTKRVKIYEEVISYLRELGVKINKENIAVKKNSSIILTFFPLLVKSLFSHPEIFPDVIKGAGIFIKGIPGLLRDNRLALVYKSMEDHNMFSDNDRITLIDFELSCFAHPLTEIAQLLVFSFDNSDFISAFVKTKTMRDIYKNKNQVSMLRTISLYEVFVQLAFGPKTDYSRNSSFLKYLINNYEN